MHFACNRTVSMQIVTSGCPLTTVSFRNVKTRGMNQMTFTHDNVKNKHLVTGNFLVEYDTLGGSSNGEAHDRIH